ncbi:hypothetical protein Moror_14533 [Moniliophthora roreri MCA 2997]|uniref:Extracellular membrane protein CFEM domain-containing protein n=2 Tax=Moniliophthora roreri TaxID=221103 RepID=V2XHX8_MONRO|nr:hypothetical protein Moror_14533 [Moniliophthora roreri MCA 2997]KAI3604182.1 hypothetical protein WG66_010135 [Moniliophthora roreri]
MLSKALFFLLAQRVVSNHLPLIPRQSSTQRFNISTPWGEISSYPQCTSQCQDLTQGSFISCATNSDYFSCVCTKDVSDDYENCLTCIANTQTWNPNVQAQAQASMNAFTDMCRANGHQLDYETININTVGSSNNSSDANLRFNASTPWGEINGSNWPQCNDDCRIVYDTSKENGFAACGSSSNYFNCVCRNDTAGDYEDCLSCTINNVQPNDNARLEAQTLMNDFTNACRARGYLVNYETVQARAGNVATGGNSGGNGSSTGNSNSGGTGNGNTPSENVGNAGVVRAPMSLWLFVLCGVALVPQI